MNDQIPIEEDSVASSVSNSQGEDFQQVFEVIETIDMGDREDTNVVTTMNKHGRPRKVAKKSSKRKSSHQAKENTNNSYNLRERPVQENSSSPDILQNETVLVHRPQRILNKPPISNNSNKDSFCWMCHMAGIDVNCHHCVRSYHKRCLKRGTVFSENWICCECVDAPHDRTEVNEFARASKRKRVGLTHLSQMLKYGLNKMLQHYGVEYFKKPVDTEMHPDYDNYIIKRMDLSTLELNIDHNMYKKPEAFLADCKWILHNSIVYDFGEEKRVAAAKSIIKVSIEEVKKIKVCQDCYFKGMTWDDDIFFTDLCSKAHLPIWAKVRGYPYWPAKLISVNLGMGNVRFFGKHEHSRIPLKDCYLYDGKKPLHLYKGNLLPLIIESFQELDIYIDNLEKRFGSICYFPFDTKFDPKIEEYFYSYMFPNYNETKPCNETCSNSNKKNSEDKTSIGSLENGNKTVKEIKVTRKAQNSSLPPPLQTRSSSNPDKPSNDQISISNTAAKQSSSAMPNRQNVKEVPDTLVMPIENEEASQPTSNARYVPRYARKSFPRPQRQFIEMQKHYIEQLNSLRIQNERQDKSASNNTSVNVPDIGNEFIVNTHIEKAHDHSNNTSISSEIRTEELPSTSGTLNETQLQMNSRLTLGDDASALTGPSELPENQSFRYSQGVPSEEQNSFMKILHDNAEKMSNYFIQLMQETVYEMADAGCKNAMIRKLQLENEALKLRHAEEMRQLMSDREVMLCEAREAEVFKQGQQEQMVIQEELEKTNQAVNAVKLHQWNLSSTSSSSSSSFSEADYHL